MIVRGEIEVHPVLPQERGKRGDKVAMVSVHSVGKHGVVSDDAGESSPGRAQLFFEPIPLVCLFAGVEMESLGVLVGEAESGSVDGARVCVDEEECCEGPPIFPVPFCRHVPARFG